MNTAADLSTTVSALGREVPIWVFLVVTVLLVLGGVAAFITRHVRVPEGGSSLARPTPLYGSGPVRLYGSGPVRRGRGGVPPGVRGAGAGVLMSRRGKDR